MAEGANAVLQKAQYGSAAFELEVLDPNNSRCAFDSGCGIAIFAELSSGAILCGEALGAPGKPAEKVGAEAARKLIDQLKTGSPVDKHLADQLVVWASLADGQSRLSITELTLHTLTAAEISKRIVGAEFRIEGQIGKPGTLICSGIGLRNELL
jgi:RNA 3'-terminal phosphate cyclase (ATP)